MGEHSDGLKEQVQSVAPEQVQKAKAVGEKVADEAKSMADEAAGTLDEKTPDGATLVDKVETTTHEAGERLKRTAADEAKNQRLAKNTS